MNDFVRKPITERLTQLPAKVGQKLLGQLNLGHLDEPTLHTVLDAAQLAGDPSKSLWFTSSYLFLRSKGVPVGDVVAMAKQHDRKIRLEWSEQRWHNEHNKLSRLATLKMLAAKSVTYNLELFGCHLPPVFPGYLIKSSRRLGMEGLRQQHCVASYHDRLASGQTAILCFFLDKTRWTVELIRTANETRPMRIGQIKTKLNALATDAIRKRIHDVLGIEFTPVDKIMTEDVPLHQRNLAAILPVLRELQIQEVYVCFSGSGDDGCIDYVNISPELVEQPSVVLQDDARDFHDGQWIIRPITREMRLHKALEHIVYGYLEMTGIDWYNNDGGQGHFSINFDTGEMEFEVETNYTETEVGYANEWNIDEFLVEHSIQPEVEST